MQIAIPTNKNFINLIGNKRNSKLIRYGNEEIPYMKAAEILGLKYSGVLDRVRRNWSVEKIMTTKRIGWYD